jgi:hypothetical protein
MEHEEAVRLMATEKYLLDELTPELRETFEEHFFVCQTCATDVRSGAAFLEHSKAVLSSSPVARPELVGKAKPGWLAWLQPAFALPVIALLAGIVAYQNFVVHPTPKQQQAAVAPQILPAISLISVSTRGGGRPAVLNIQPGGAFLLFVDVPPDTRFSSYVGELYSPSGKREWSLPISAAATRDTLPISVPPGLKTAGTYKLTVSGVAADGSSVEVGRYPFELQFR